MAKKAADLIKSGFSKEDVRKATGWFRGMDKKWRFEIDDSAMGLRNVNREPGQKHFLGDVIEHERLFAAYPQLRDVTVKFVAGKRGKGAYDRVENVIELSANTGRRTLLHEVQHAIQELEGFAKGGNPEFVKALINSGMDLAIKKGDQARYDRLAKFFIKMNDYESYRNIAGEVEAFDVGKRADLGGYFRKAISPDLRRGVFVIE
jgi:hypothetical protein